MSEGPGAPQAASLVALAGAYSEERTAELDPSTVDVPFLLRSRKLGLRDGLYEAVTRSADVLPTLAGLCCWKCRTRRRSPASI